MKKMISILTAAISSANALVQNKIETSRQQRNMAVVGRKVLRLNSSKNAKKQAREYKKGGWTVLAGEEGIEQQITASQLYAQEMMVHENGEKATRFIMYDGTTIAGSYSTGYATARYNAQSELAAMIKIQIVSMMRAKLHAMQSSSALSAVADMFNQHARDIVDEALNNSVPVLVFYRGLPSNMYEVHVRLAFDKKVLASRMKLNMQKQLNQNVSQLIDIVDNVLDAVA